MIDPAASRKLEIAVKAFVAAADCGQKRKAKLVLHPLHHRESFRDSERVAFQNESPDSFDVRFGTAERTWEERSSGCKRPCRRRRRGLPLI